ncbi:MAG TPA: hypothetical protein VIS07_08815 [Candidatus Binatia bacterium]
MSQHMLMVLLASVINVAAPEPATPCVEALAKLERRGLEIVAVEGTTDHLTYTLMSPPEAARHKSAILFCGTDFDLGGGLP